MYTLYSGERKDREETASAASSRLIVLHTDPGVSSSFSITIDQVGGTIVKKRAISPLFFDFLDNQTSKGIKIVLFRQK